MDLSLLFKDVPQKEDIFLQTVKKGSFVRFNYIFHKAGHPAYPDVIVTDVNSIYIRGLNINYLTFPYIRRLLQSNCNNLSFGYGSIKNDKYLVSAFRQYKRSGIRSLKKLDCDFVLNLLAGIRAVTPMEVDAIRKTVNEQLTKATNQIVASQIDTSTGQG